MTTTAVAAAARPAMAGWYCNLDDDDVHLLAAAHTKKTWPFTLAIGAEDVAAAFPASTAHGFRRGTRLSAGNTEATSALLRVLNQVSYAVHVIQIGGGVAIIVIAVT